MGSEGCRTAALFSIKTASSAASVSSGEYGGGRTAYVPLWAEAELWMTGNDGVQPLNTSFSDLAGMTSSASSKGVAPASAPGLGAAAAGAEA